MKSGSKSIIIGFSILALVGLALIAFFFLQIKNNVETMYAAEAGAQATAASAQESQTLEQLVTTLQPEIDDLTSRVIPSDGAAAFIEMIESLARASGLKVTISSVSDSSASPGGTPSGDGAAPASGPGSYQLLTLDVSTTGSWKDTHSFLLLLQTLPYKVDLSAIGLTENGEAGVESGDEGSGQAIEAVESTGGSTGGPSGSKTTGPSGDAQGSVWNGQFTLNVLQAT